MVLVVVRIVDMGDVSDVCFRFLRGGVERSGREPTASSVSWRWPSWRRASTPATSMVVEAGLAWDIVSSEVPVRRFLVGGGTVEGGREICGGGGSLGVFGTTDDGVAGVCGVESVPVRPPQVWQTVVSILGDKAPEAPADENAAAAAAAFFLPFLRGWYRYSGYRARCCFFSSYIRGAGCQHQGNVLLSIYLAAGGW